MASSNKLSPIPRPPGKPVVGNMLSLDSSAPVQNLARLAKELGPIYWLDMMGAPLVIVSGADLVDELSDEKRFDKAVRGPLRRVRAVAGDGLFTATRRSRTGAGAQHPDAAVRHRAMQSYQPEHGRYRRTAGEKWDRLNADDEIDVVHDMTALTLDTIGLCGFDYRFNSFYRQITSFVESLVRSLETIMMIRGCRWRICGCRSGGRDLAQDVTFMNKMVDEIVASGARTPMPPRARRYARRHDDGRRPRHRRAARRRQHPLPDQHILDRGTRDPSGLLSCTIYALLKHPEVLKKAYEEVDRRARARHRHQATSQQVTQAHLHSPRSEEALALVAPAVASRREDEPSAAYS